MTTRARRRIAPLAFAVLALLLALSLLSRPPADPFQASAVVDPPFPSLTYGIHTFLWWDNGNAGTHLDWVRLLSYSHVKQIFAWSDIEPQPGIWQWSQADRIVAEVERRGLRLILRLGRVPGWARSPSQLHAHDAPPTNMTQWRNYCAAVAQRYRGRVAAYQIWNEPNLSREWGDNPPDPAAYVQLLDSCSAAIHAADPAAIRISAGLAPTGTTRPVAMPDDIYLDHMYRQGFQQHIDAVGVHAPGFAAPEIGPDDPDTQQRWFSFRRIEDLRKIMLHHDDAARQMAILEFGYTTDKVNPSYSWYAVSENEQAEMLLRAYEYAIANWRPWVGLMSLIYLPDPAWLPSDEEYWWSIVEPRSDQPRPAFFAVANMRKVCDDHIIPARPPDSPAASGLVPAPICP